MNPLVSILVPCYNGELFLKETLNDLQNQTLTNWECIIIDDGSTDRTAEIAKSFSIANPKFTYIYQKNRGLSAARNTGLLAAKGSFIQLLDSDDFLSYKKLALQVQFMNDNSDADITYTDAFYFQDKKHGPLYKAFHISEEEGVYFTQETWIPEFNTASGHMIIDYLLWANIAPVNSMLIRKEVFKVAGYFKKSFLSLEDWEFWMRCALNGLKFDHFKDPLAYALIRVHSSSMTFNSERMNKFFTQLQLMTLEKLKNSKIAGLNEIYKLNSPHIYYTLRKEIKDKGLFNFKQLKKIRSRIKLKTFIILYLKELNSYRKELLNKSNV